MDPSAKRNNLIFTAVVSVLILGGTAGAWIFNSAPQSNQDSNTQPPSRQQAPTTSPAAAAPPPYSPPSMSANANGDIAAQNIIAINANKTFSLAEFPDAQFKINKIYKASGGLTISQFVPCGNSSGSATHFIFLKYLMPGASPAGLCLDTENTTVEDQPVALVAIDLEVFNNGANSVDGTFLQLFYNVMFNGKQVSRLAQTNPPWGSYGAGALSSRRILLGFEVPSGQNDFQLTFGNYGSAGTVKGPDFFSKSTGGFLINFEKETVSDLPG